MTGRIVVVTGTGTDVGKTIATAGLAASCGAAGLRVAAVKPAQTGLGPEEAGDLDVVRTLGGAATVWEPVRLPEPLAPDTAARRAGIPLPTVASVVPGVVELATGHDIVLVEGAGGVLVRLDEHAGTIADLALAVRTTGLETAVVVVTTPGLGTLNHTELTVEALRSRDLEPAGLIIGAWPADPGLAERCNLKDLSRIGVPILGRIPAGAGRMAPQEFRAAAAGWLSPPPW